MGLALRGYEVVATDLSSGMVARTRALARQHDVDVGMAGRRSALAAMRAQLQPGGVLAITSRNWELVLASGSGLNLPSDLAIRRGVPAVVIHSWTLADHWELPHFLDVGVALIQDNSIVPHVGRLTFWPFTHEELHDDLQACGLMPEESTLHA